MHVDASPASSSPDASRSEAMTSPRGRRTAVIAICMAAIVMLTTALLVLREGDGRRTDSAQSSPLEPAARGTKPVAPRETALLVWGDGDLNDLDARGHEGQSASPAGRGDTPQRGGVDAADTEAAGSVAGSVESSGSTSPSSAGSPWSDPDAVATSRSRDTILAWSDAWLDGAARGAGARTDGVPSPTTAGDATSLAGQAVSEPSHAGPSTPQPTATAATHPAARSAETAPDFGPQSGTLEPGPTMPMAPPPPAGVAMAPRSDARAEFASAAARSYGRRQERPQQADAPSGSPEGNVADISRSDTGRERPDPVGHSRASGVPSPKASAPGQVMPPTRADVAAAVSTPDPLMPPASAQGAMENARLPGEDRLRAPALPAGEGLPPAVLLGKGMRGKLSPPSWQFSLTRDAVVSTQPIPEGQVDESETRRRVLLKQRRAEVSVGFDQARLAWGVAVEPGESSGSAAWRVIRGTGAVREQREGGRILLILSEAPVNGTHYELRASGSANVLAQIEIDPSGGVGVKAADGVRMTFWFSAEAVFDGAATKEEGNSRMHELAWSQWGGRPLPDSWIQKFSAQRGRWRSGFEIPLDDAQDSGRTWHLALRDPASGWAWRSSLQME